MSEAGGRRLESGGRGLQAGGWQATRQRALRAVWTILFVVALAAVPVLNRSYAGSGGESDSGSPGALTRYGFRLEEVAKQIGVDAVHQAPTFDQQFDHIMPQVAAMGAAVAFA